MTVARASTLLELGRPAEALDALAGLGDEGASAHAHCLRAQAYLLLRRHPEATASAMQARALAPSGEWGYRLGSIAAIREGRLREAMSLADEAVRLAPHTELTHHVSSLANMQIGNLPVARQRSEEMLRLAPSNPLSHQTLGRVLFMQGQLPAAEAALRQALALKPQDAETMSLLASVTARQGRGDEADSLRLSAVRADPQNTRRQRSLLRRGGTATTGGLLFAGKLGFFKFIVALNAVRIFGAQGSGSIAASLVAVVCLVAVFVVTRVRRHRRGRALPPLVWEGLRPARRNSDLLWLAWPAAFVAVASVLGIVGALVNGGSVAVPVCWLAGAFVVLALCWRLRQGEARKMSLRDLPRGVVRTVRFLVEGQRARRGRGSAGIVWVRDESATPQRWPRALLFLGVDVVVAASVGARYGPGAFWLVMLGTATVLGAGLDGADRVHRVSCSRVVRRGTTQRASRWQLAVRAALRLALLPVIVVEGIFVEGEAHRFVHDRLTGTEYIGLRPEGPSSARGTS